MAGGTALRLAAAACAFATVSVVVHAPALAGKFIWDDVDIYIVNNQTLAKPDGLWRFWFSTEPLDYYPLTYTTFWFEAHWLWGPNNTVGYHVVNAVLHGVGAAGLWWALAQLRVPGAWAAALLFVVHPGCVESVDWICQRKTLLGGAFAFWSAAFWIAGRWKTAFLCFVLSLAGKPVAIGLPIWLVVLEWRRGSLSRATFLKIAPFFAASAVFGVVGLWFQQVNVIGTIPIRGDSKLERAVVVSWTLWFYAWKGLWPFGLCFVYPRWTVDWRSPTAYLPALALVAIFWMCWRSRNGVGRHVLLGLAWYVLMVLPGSGLVDVFYWRYSFVGDHYQYPALPATIAGLVASVCLLANKVRAPAGLLRLAFVLTFMLWSAQTLRLAGDYESAERLWTATLSRNPEAWLAHTNLAGLLNARGNTPEALRHYERAMKLRPDLAESHNNMGMVHSLRGEPPEAVAAFREAVRLKPGDAQYLHNLGVELGRLGNPDESLAVLRQAVDAERRGRRSGQPFVEPLDELGYLLARLGRETEALEAFAEAERLNPRHKLPFVGRAFLHERRGDWQGVVAELSRAVEVVPNDADVHFRLAIAADRVRDYRRALKSLEVAALSDAKAIVAQIWLLAACPDSAVRNPRRAWELFDEFDGIGASTNPAHWDLRSVCLAANEDFGKAMQANALAQKLLSERQHSAEDLVKLQKRAALFREGKPFVGPLSEIVRLAPEVQPAGRLP